MRTNLDRRTFLRSTAAVSAAALLAGCGGAGGEGGDGTGGSNAPSGDAADYAGDSDNFDGTVVDMTGQDEVTVAVGAEGNGGAFAFDPPAVRVSTGTPVVWEWTGEGGTHNVVAEDGSFDSGPAVAEAGTTFEHTFDDAGTTLYKCVPHVSLGMKGAIVVE